MQNLEFGIDCDSRVALVGPNGAGTHVSPCRSASMTLSALMCGTGSCELSPCLSGWQPPCLPLELSAWPDSFACFEADQGGPYPERM